MEIKNNQLGAIQQEVNEEVANDNFNLFVNKYGMWNSSHRLNPQKVIATQQMRAKVTVEPDPGADDKVMDEYQFSKLKKEITETNLKKQS